MNAEKIEPLNFLYKEFLYSPGTVDTKRIVLPGWQQRYGPDLIFVDRKFYEKLHQRPSEYQSNE